MLQNLLSLFGLVRKFPAQLIASLTELITSPCLLCGVENSRAICCDCHQQFFSNSSRGSQRCVICALPIPTSDSRCGNCLANPPAFHSTAVACDYMAPLDQLVLALKFGHQLPVAKALALLLAEATLASPHYSPPELLIPVPLSRTRLTERGFNQAYEIAKPFAKLLHRPVYPQLLLRIRETIPQTLLHPDQRHENLHHAFSPNPAYADKIRGRHIGVIDDVMTTGATLHEIAACLQRHGAKRVSNFVFARTPPH